MSMLGSLSQLSVAEAVAIPVMAGERSASQFSSASTVYAGGHEMEGTGSTLSVTVMVCKQVALAVRSQWSVAVTVQVRAML